MQIDTNQKTKGVSFDSNENKFRVRITNPVNGRRLFLGRFESKRDAVIAWRTAEAVFKLI